MKTDWKDQTWSKDQMNDLRNLAVSFLREGHYDKAIDLFEALIVLQSDFLYDFQTLGALYLQVKKPKQALIYFEQALNLYPGDPSTLLNQAKALIDLGRLEEGLLILKRLETVDETKIAKAAQALLMAHIPVQDDVPDALSISSKKRTH